MDTNGIGGIVCFILGWLIAQAGKLLADIIRSKKAPGVREFLRVMTRSGGMPSGHTASFVGLSMYLGMTYGFLSSIFALAVCTTIIVIYDAVNVRYAVGEQGKLLNVIVMDNNYSKRKVKVVEGHTIPQVIVGTIIGIIIGFLISLAF